MFMIQFSDWHSCSPEVKSRLTFRNETVIFWELQVYFNTSHEYIYVCYNAFFLFCRSVWPQPGDSKLFISRGSLNSALGVRECKRGSLCIIQFLYIQAFRYICAVMHRGTHTAAAAQKANIHPRDIYRCLTLCHWGDKSVRKQKRYAKALFCSLCLGGFFPPCPAPLPPHIFFLSAPVTSAAGPVGGGGWRQCISRARVHCLP